MNMTFVFSAYKTNYVTQNSVCTYRKETENKVHKVQRPVNNTVSNVTDLQANLAWCIFKEIYSSSPQAVIS